MHKCFDTRRAAWFGTQQDGGQNWTLKNKIKLCSERQIQLQSPARCSRDKTKVIHCGWRSEVSYRRSTLSLTWWPRTQQMQTGSTASTKTDLFGRPDRQKTFNSYGLFAQFYSSQADKHSGGRGSASVNSYRIQQMHVCVAFESPRCCEDTQLAWRWGSWSGGGAGTDKQDRHVNVFICCCSLVPCYAFTIRVFRINLRQF